MEWLVLLTSMALSIHLNEPIINNKELICFTTIMAGNYLFISHGDYQESTGIVMVIIIKKR